MDLIIYAASTGNVQVLRIALEEFPNHLSMPLELGYLLPLTMKGKHFSCFELLLQSGATWVSIAMSPLHMACQLPEFLPYLELLIAHKAVCLDIPNVMGHTPLHVACLSSNFECAEHLLNNGANIEARCARQNILFTMHVSKGLIPLWSLFSTTELTWKHRTSLEKGLYMWHARRITCLVLSVFWTEEYKLIPRNLKERRLSQLQLKERAWNVLNRDITGRTNLHWACMNEDGFPIVKALIEGGADVNAEDHKCRTPLYVVCEFPYLDILELLLDNKADANIDNHKGNNPMHRAVTRENTDVTTHLDIVNLLLDNGCNAEIKNGQGKAPADVAIHPQIRDHLRNYLSINPWSRRSIIVNF